MSVVHAFISVKRNVVSPAGEFSTVMRPPCASTSERLMYRPEPDALNALQLRRRGALECASTG
jgi:hypothetical protein